MVLTLSKRDDRKYSQKGRVPEPKYLDGESPVDYGPNASYLGSNAPLFSGIVACLTAEPVTVEEDKLEIDSAALDIDKVYRFEYLDVKMVLWKSDDGTVDIYQVVED
jgi:hypothetical protein